ncbi:MAG: SDR family NAD(P)-dependent oxidoreductase [Acidimicrobiales bacterium]
MGLLDGKVAIVTGAGHGVGRGEALILAAEGAKVVVNDLGGGVGGGGASDGPAEDVASIIRSRGGEAVANADDVADWEGAGRLVRQAVDTWGTLDVLVNNAGILRDKMIFSMTEDDFDSVVRVHLKGSFATTHHAAVYWRAQHKAGAPVRAAIVNTVSSAGLQGNVGQANYGSAKAAIAALTIISSLELARLGVRVNAVAPGGMTRMSGGVVRDVELKEPDAYEGYHPMNPGNSAPTVAWLASDQAMHVTGQVFRAVGSTISHYIPWTLGDEVVSANGEQWVPADIAAAVNAQVFRSRHPGLQISRMQAGTR